MHEEREEQIDAAPVDAGGPPSEPVEETQTEEVVEETIVEEEIVEEPVVEEAPDASSVPPATAPDAG